MIFLVRRVTSPVERMDLLSRHYIFADPEAVASALHKALSAPLDHTMPLLQDIRLFCDSTMRMSLKPATLYAGVAVVQATPFDGLRLLLEQGNRSQLPMQEICPISKISNEHDDLTGTLEELGEAITWLDGMTLLSVISRNMTVDPEQLGGPRVTRLLLALERAIVPMLDDMLTAEDMMHILPRLFLHPVLVPLTPGGSLKATQLSGYVPPHIVVFYAHYDAAVNTFTDKWLPFSLFRAQNACVMAQKIRSTSRAEDIIATNTTTDPQAEEVNVQRRPSKVQFDFPPQLGEKETPPFAQNNDVVSPAISNRFSFPARSHETCPLETTRNPSVRGNGPRRSSLARSQFNSTSAEGPHPLDTPNVKQAIPRSASDICPGVASWDPEWLLVLLRTKLRADA